MEIKIILKIKKWWWKRKGYRPLVIHRLDMWKVGNRGSITDIGVFIIRGLEPPNIIWVEMVK